MTIPKALNRTSAETSLLFEPPGWDVLQHRAHQPFPWPTPQVRVHNGRFHGQEYCRCRTSGKPYGWEAAFRDPDPGSRQHQGATFRGGISPSRLFTSIRCRADDLFRECVGLEEIETGVRHLENRDLLSNFVLPFLALVGAKGSHNRPANEPNKKSDDA